MQPNPTSTYYTSLRAIEEKKSRYFYPIFKYINVNYLQLKKNLLWQLEMAGESIRIIPHIFVFFFF